MSWASFLAGILAGGVIAGSMAFALGATIGMLIGQQEAVKPKPTDQLDEDVVYDAMDGLDFMLDESKREN